ALRLLSRKSAPDTTKKHIKIGGVILSIKLVDFLESIPKFVATNEVTINVINHERSYHFAIALKRKIVAIVNDRSSLSVFIYFERYVKRTPPIAPRITEKITSAPGSTNIFIMFKPEPLRIFVAIDNATPNMIIDTASSNATTGISRSTSFPFALYSRMTINVAAGAVAQAILPNSNANGTCLVTT